MKPLVVLAVSALTLCLVHSAASAMSTVPFSGRNPGPSFSGPLNDPAGNPVATDSNGTRNGWGAFSPQGAPRPTGQRPPKQDGGFLNIDPFDPNSVMNSYDRNRYANPYPYNPIYNPYGQSRDPFAPTSPNVPGQGIPYRR